MKKDILLKPAADWSGGNIAERIDNCRSMLFAHGFITMAENDRIFAKINKRYAEAVEAKRNEQALGSIHTLGEG